MSRSYDYSIDDDEKIIRLNKMATIKEEIFEMSPAHSKIRLAIIEEKTKIREN